MHEEYASIVESGAVSSLQARSPNDTTLLISWEPPATTNGAILNYSIGIYLINGSIVRQEITLDTMLVETNLGENNIKSSSKAGHNILALLCHYTILLAFELRP
jgi:hypothetical protein